MQKELKGEIKKLQKENEKLNERMIVPEDRITAMEKEKWKKNIIIKGIKTDNENQLKCLDVETFVESNLKIKVKGDSNIDQRNQA